MNISFWSVRSILLLVVAILALTRLSSISNTISFGLLCSVKLITASGPILFTARVSLLTASMACTNLYLSHPDLGNLSPWNFWVAFLWPCANMMLFGSLSVASPRWLFFCPVTRQHQPLKLLICSSPMFGHTLASHATSFLIMILDSSAPFGRLFGLCFCLKRFTSGAGSDALSYWHCLPGITMNWRQTHLFYSLKSCKNSVLSPALLHKLGLAFLRVYFSSRCHPLESFLSFDWLTCIP